MTEQTFNIQRIYLKTSSFDTIGAPELFKKQGQINHAIEMNIDHMNLMEEDLYEVTLTLKVIGKLDEEEIFKVKAQQAGVFQIKGFSDEEQRRVLRAYCANLLYPYARQIISELAVQATFPTITLAPINFDVLYEQQKQQQNSSENVSIH